MIDEKLLVTTQNGVETIDPEQVEKLVAMKQAKEEDYKNFESEVREVILNLMAKYGTVVIKSQNYIVSKVSPADKVEFDEEKFLLETSEDILSVFVDVIEEKTFDEEAFKNEHPDLYEQYVKTNYISHVNTKKLAKTFPAIYDRYTTTIKSDRAPTIRIVGNKK